MKNTGLSFAVDVSVFTLAVVTLAVGPLHNAGRPNAVAGVTVAVAMAVSVSLAKLYKAEEDGEGESQHRGLHYLRQE